MKHLIAIAFFLAIFLSCKENNSTDPTPDSQSSMDSNLVVVSSAAIKNSLVSVD
ncbi:hypothetical protein [Ravibacter arvi]|uniref:hypothetical protein n=1 Tax=Ravibacter arvi TaxID=2051041 RepID=UPI0031EB7008